MFVVTRTRSRHVLSRRRRENETRSNVFRNGAAFPFAVAFLASPIAICTHGETDGRAVPSEKVRRPEITRVPEHFRLRNCVTAVAAAVAALYQKTWRDEDRHCACGRRNLRGSPTRANESNRKRSRSTTALCALLIFTS